jgi:small subunit ribosomal protein S21
MSWQEVSGLTQIKVRDQQSFEKALRRFKRECLREGVIADMRRKEFYEKPSIRRRRKANRARRRRQRLELRRQRAAV